MQTLYIYFGVAALVGGLAGAGLHFVFGVLADGYGLGDRAGGGEERGRERGGVERRGKGKGKMQVGIGSEGSVDWVWRGRTRARNGPVMTSTILEEEDSSDVGF